MKWIPRTSLGAVLIGILLAPSPARATLQLTLTVTGNGYTTPQTETIPTNSGGTILATPSFTSPMTSGFTLPFAGFNLTSLTANSNTGIRSLLDSPFMVTNSGSGGTLTLTLSDDGMPTPPGSPTYGLNVSSTATVNNSTGTVTFQSFAGTGLNDVSGFSTPLQSYSPTTNASSTVVSSGFRPSGSNFSITNVSTFDLGNQGSVLVFSGSTIVSTPEPATLAMTAAGLPVIGLIGWRRRRARNSGQV